jgi:hypothetical protein
MNPNNLVIRSEVWQHMIMDMFFIVSQGSTRGKWNYPNRANNIRRRRHLAGYKEVPGRKPDISPHPPDMSSVLTRRYTHSQWSCSRISPKPWHSLNCVLVASLALLVYDQIITWDREVDRIWWLVSFIETIIENSLICFWRAVAAIGFWRQCSLWAVIGHWFSKCEFSSP